LGLLVLLDRGHPKCWPVYPRESQALP
jgi:hypothetical protein